MVLIASSRFNPRTRDGCEALGIRKGAFEEVSIHAPVMGANDDNQEFLVLGSVSIHAPVMGANWSRQLL